MTDIEGDSGQTALSQEFLRMGKWASFTTIVNKIRAVIQMEGVEIRKSGVHDDLSSSRFSPTV
jgi:hypothetical protein